MNSLVSKLENASLDEKNLNYQVGNLIEKIESIKVNDPGSNWVELCINYANLNYLLKYIDEHDKSPKFMKTLKNILSELDIIHQKYLNEISLSSPAMMSLALVSNGSRMDKPKLDSRLGPSWPAFIMPSPAPVMAIQCSAAMDCPKERAAM